MSREHLRLGLIGLGHWGRALARTLADFDDAQLVRVSTSDPSRLAPLGLHCETTPAWREVAAARDLDGVIVAVPPHVQPAMVEEVIAAGIAVLSEKPLAMSVPAAERIRAHAAARGVFVLVDHTQIFSPAYVALRQLVGSARDVRRIDSRAGAWGPFRQGVPVLWDWGPHDVALLIDLLAAAPVRVGAKVIERRSLPGGAAETLELRLGFPRSVDVRCEISNIATVKRRVFAVRLDEETLIFEDDDGHRLLRERAGVPPEVVPTSPERPLRRVLRAFLKGIRDGGDGTSLDLAVEVVRVLAQCEAALDAEVGTGRPIAL